MDIASWPLPYAAVTFGPAFAFVAVRIAPAAEDISRHRTERCRSRAGERRVGRGTGDPSDTGSSTRASAVGATLADRQLTQADAAALAEAGLMPLAVYLDLAASNGWNPSEA
jgi:hypothetical protein